MEQIEINASRCRAPLLMCCSPVFPPDDMGSADRILLCSPLTTRLRPYHSPPNQFWTDLAGSSFYPSRLSIHHIARRKIQCGCEASRGHRDMGVLLLGPQSVGEGIEKTPSSPL